MGLESYFITLLPPDTKPLNIDGNIGFKGESHITVDKFIKEISICYDLKQIKEKEWYWFKVEDIIVMRIEYQDKWLNAVSLEGSFSWYEESLRKCYNISQTINNIFDVIVYHPFGLEFKLGSEEEFLSRIKEIYQHKYQLFLKQFGGLNIKVAPVDFYEALNTNRLKKLINSIRAKMFKI